jgi:hypothetical protein
MRMKGDKVEHEKRREKLNNYHPFCTFRRFDPENVVMLLFLPSPLRSVMLLSLLSAIDQYKKSKISKKKKKYISISSPNLPC